MASFAPNKKRSLTTAMKWLLVFLLFHLLIVLTQTWAFFDYDRMALSKLQEPRFLADEAVVQSNRAICAAHFMVMLPLNILAIAGLTRYKFYGVVCTWMLLGTAMYWPINFLASRYTYMSANIRHVPLNGADSFICTFVLATACWFSWYLYKSRLVPEWCLLDLGREEKHD